MARRRRFFHTPTRRGRRGRGGELLPAPPLEANPEDVTDPKPPPPARNGKSAIHLENLTQGQEIQVTPPLARGLKTLRIDNTETKMETTVSMLASIPVPISEAPELQTCAEEQVGARAHAGVVKVESWFTAGAALRVAQLKGVQHLLVLDRGRVLGAIGLVELALAPPTRPLGRCMPLNPPIVASDTPVQDARRLMSVLGVDCMVVTAGPLLVGLVTRDDLEDDHERAAG